MNQGMGGGWSYYQLFGSLPPLPMSFEVARLPISAVRLEERFRELPEADWQAIERWREILFWDRQKEQWSDQEVLSRYETFLKSTSNPLVRDLAKFRIELRLIVAAIRIRRKGGRSIAGNGDLEASLRRNWQEPLFGLGGQRPWIAPVARALEDGNLEQADKAILNVAYQHYSRLAEIHRYSFEAAVLYLARWDVLARWLAKDKELGRQRLDQLVTEAIGDYRRLF